MTPRTHRVAVAAVALLLSTASAPPPTPNYDTVLRGGMIYDGSGGAARTGDVAIKGDRIVYVGPRAPGTATTVVDLKGLASRRASSTCSAGRSNR